MMARETGYRFADVAGNRGKYRSDENFGNGVRLLGSSFSINSKDGHGWLFDEILLNTQGLGNDPYESASLRIQKNKVYRYDMLWRLNDYYNPGLTIAGNCRMCLVDIEKMPKLQIGCATQAAQGMVVRTANERVARTRQGIMEFLLINHPLDCPICDQAGECRLQQYEAAYGAGFSRFNEEKVHAAGQGQDAGLVTTQDLLRQVDVYRRIRAVVEKIRYGQYL